MRIDRRQMMLAGGVVAAALVFGLFIWWPAHSEIKILRQEIGKVEKDLLGVSGRTEGLRELVAEVDGLRAEVNQTRKVIPASRDLSDLMLQFSLQIEQDNLQKHVIREEPTKPGNGYQVLPLEVEFEGDSTAAFRFMRKVETMSRLVQVRSLSLKRKPPTRDARSGKVEKKPASEVVVNMSLNTFYYDPRERKP